MQTDTEFLVSPDQRSEVASARTGSSEAGSAIKCGLLKGLSGRSHRLQLSGEAVPTAGAFILERSEACLSYIISLGSSAETRSQFLDCILARASTHNFVFGWFQTSGVQNPFVEATTI